MKKDKKDFGRNKSTDTLPIDVSSGKHPQQSSIYQSQTSKKDQDHQRGSQRNKRQRQDGSHDSSTTSVNPNVIRKKESISSTLCASTTKKGALPQQVSSKTKQGIKKLVLVLASFTSVIATKKKTVRADEDGEDGKYSGNLVQVPGIRYPIIFRRKSMLNFFNLNSEVNAIDPTFA